MGSLSVTDGFRPPQQERSRAALSRVMEAAESVLADEGIDAFTMSTVAERANTSVGAIYRRFDGKDQLLAAVKDRLLTRLEADLADQMTTEKDLAGAVAAFTHALADTFSAHGHVIAQLLREADTAMEERGTQALDTIASLFRAGVGSHRAEVLRSDPESALEMVRSTIVGACIHRGASGQDEGDKVAWKTYADRLTDMVIVYLTTKDRRTRRRR